MTDFDERELRIDTWSTLHTRHVRITHLPTGAVATGASRDEALVALAERVREQIMDAYEIPAGLREAWDQIKQGDDT